MIAADFIKRLQPRIPRIRRTYFSRARYGPNRIDMPGWRWWCSDEIAGAEGTTPGEAYNNWADAVRGDGR